MKKIGDPLLYKIENNKELVKDKNFALLLAASLQTYYISKQVEVAETEILKIIGKSKVNPNITLMPLQLKFLRKMKDTKKLIISAPTSFGKTFLTMEHIRRNTENYNTIFYIVHTNSLKDELVEKFNKNLSEYEILENIDETEDVQKELKKRIYVLVSDGQSLYNYKNDIDLLVVDEAYNLNNKQSNERYYCIMQSYYALLKNAKKIFLLGPFISDKEGNESREFELIKTSFSPVGTRIQNMREGESAEKLFIEKINKNENTIGYFNSKQDIYEYLNKILQNNELQDKYFNDPIINMMEREFPSYWLLPKIMKKGIGVYHSAFPKYINIYNMNKFNSNEYKGLLTTSAILEGVNTAARNLIIFKTMDGTRPLTPFRFFNLCGRVGRLGEEIIGDVYNFGESYDEKYKEREQKLIIGSEKFEDEYEEFDDNVLKDKRQVDSEVKKKINEIYKQLNIDFDKEYPSLSFFSNGSKGMLLNLEKYIKFKVQFKEFLNSKDSKNKDKKTTNKNKILDFIYDNYIKEIKKNYRPNANCGFFARKVLEVVLRSEYKGIDLSIKKVMVTIEQEVEKFKELTITQKNQYVIELMRLVYDYIPHDFYNATYLLTTFIENDTYFTEEEKQNYKKYFYNRVQLYLAGGEEEYKKTVKLLRDIGMMPSMIKEIIKEIKNDNLNDSISRKEIIIYIKEKIRNRKIKFSSEEQVVWNLILG